MTFAKREAVSLAFGKLVFDFIYAKLLKPSFGRSCICILDTKCRVSEKLYDDSYDRLMTINMNILYDRYLSLEGPSTHTSKNVRCLAPSLLKRDSKTDRKESMELAPVDSHLYKKADEYDMHSTIKTAR